MKEPTQARAEQLRRGQAMYEQRVRERQQTRDEYARYHREHKIGPRAGDCYGDCRGNMANLDCAGLSREKAITQDAQAKQKMGEESYKKNAADRRPPAGYSNATNADLEALDLRNPATGETLLRLPGDSNFNAAVFKNDATGEYIVGFKGTEFLSGADWEANVGQNAGQKTAYYSQAMRIAQTANDAMPGRVSFVGHSLGGGLASAAAGVTGRPATTFNAAGLHPNTVPDFKGNAPINSWYVQGDVLTMGQGLTSKIRGANGRRIMIKPPLSVMDIQTDARHISRHLNGRIAAALDQRLETIKELQKSKGCPE